MSSQRKKAVMACFRMAPLHSMPHHKAINLFIKSYKQNWLDIPEENDTDISGLIPDLCTQEKILEITSTKEEEDQSTETSEHQVQDKVGIVDLTGQPGGPDPLFQLITSFNQSATTEVSVANVSNNFTDEKLYMAYAEIMSKSCEIVEEDEEGGGEPSEEDNASAFEDAELQKQKLRFEQNRLAQRGAAEMVLLYISASKGLKSDMLEKTLQLGISLLHGGNVAIQQRMYQHLREKRDVGFFTSLAGLMANCSVLDLDTFERCVKAEQFGGISSSGGNDSGEKNLHDADFTCSIFRFLQLLCEGHNLEFQNYLRVQAGNNTVVNTIICTVDYLLRLQESMMDFYWHYSGKETVDSHGRDNFLKAITVAKQVFNSLTEYIQGPCVGNQLTLAHSRLWDAIGGFLYLFANLQDKLSKDPHQIELLRELMNLQKDMIIMLLSMLEGNVLNGPIGKQMVDTLIENQQNLEMLLKFFDIFLKMKDLTTSESFLEFDINGDGWISPKEYRQAMEAQKMYTQDEIEYVLMCVDINQDGKIDFMEFTERFHNPAKDIGFNMAVLLTNLSEHMSYDSRLDRIMKKASSFLNYFEPFLGRIEISGSSGRIERVYFEITESNIEQWNAPQIKESKRQFLFDIVNEGDEKVKLEHFVNFCEDSIFEMQNAASISPSSEEESLSELNALKAEKESGWRNGLEYSKTTLKKLISLFSPSSIKSYYSQLKSMERIDIAKKTLKITWSCVMFILKILIYIITLTVKSIYLMILSKDVNKDIGEEAVKSPFILPAITNQKHNLNDNCKCLIFFHHSFQFWIFISNCERIK
jgi:ryanodine receptor 2